MDKKIDPKKTSNKTAMNKNPAKVDIEAAIAERASRERAAVNASPRIERLRERFLNTRPSVCLDRAKAVTKYYSSCLGSIPLPIRTAEAFDAICREMTLYIAPDELLVGSMACKPRAFPLYPDEQGAIMESEVDALPTRDTDPFDITQKELRELHEEIYPFWRGKFRILSFLLPLMTEDMKKLSFVDPDADKPEFSAFMETIGGGPGYACPDWERVIKVGFGNIREEARERLAAIDVNSGKDLRKIAFYKGVIISCDAIMGLSGRCAALARKMMADEKDPQRKAELAQIAEICDRVPAKPAQTFWEAMQGIWLTYTALNLQWPEPSMSMGSMDQYLYPYYQRDLEAGRITPERAQELFDCMWIKHAEQNFILGMRQNLYYPGFCTMHHIPIGGQTRAGEDASNELSYMALQATANTRLYQPNVALRVFEKTPDSLLAKACEVSRLGSGHPSFFNDEVCIPALLSSGVSLEDARDYSSLGCTAVIPQKKDRGLHRAGLLNLAACMEFVMTNGVWRETGRQISIQTGDPRKFETFYQVMEALTRQLEHLVKVHCAMCVLSEIAYYELCSTPLMSSIIGGCMESGVDRMQGGAVYNFGHNARGTGLADIADSLSAIKKLVFEEKSVTMSELIEALDRNFEAKEDESLRQMLINRAPKYGNNDDYVDMLARKAAGIYGRATKRYKTLFGHDFHPSFSSQSGNVPLGKVVGALPSGRKAGLPLAEGASPSQGRDKKGPTAVINSVGKIDTITLSGGCILNQKFHPNVLAGKEGLEKFKSLIRVYFRNKGWHCQFNVVDGNLLKDAQKNPERYPDLLVRVAGYSTLFVGLPKNVQDDIISRTEQGGM